MTGDSAPQNTSLPQYIGKVKYFSCDYDGPEHEASVRRAYTAALPFLEGCCDSLVREAGWEVLNPVDFRLEYEGYDECGPRWDSGSDVCTTCPLHRPAPSPPSMNDTIFSRCLYSPSHPKKTGLRMLIMLPKTADVFFDDRNKPWIQNWLGKLPGFGYRGGVAFRWRSCPTITQELLKRFLALLQMALPGQVGFMTYHYPSPFQGRWPVAPQLVYGRFFPPKWWCMLRENQVMVREILERRLLQPDQRFPESDAWAAHILDRAHGEFKFKGCYSKGLDYARHHNKRGIPFKYSAEWGAKLLTPVWLRFSRRPPQSASQDRSHTPPLETPPSTDREASSTHPIPKRPRGDEDDSDESARSRKRARTGTCAAGLGPPPLLPSEPSEAHTIGAYPDALARPVDNVLLRSRPFSAPAECGASHQTPDGRSPTSNKRKRDGDESAGRGRSVKRTRQNEEENPVQRAVASEQPERPLSLLLKTASSQSYDAAHRAPLTESHHGRGSVKRSRDDSDQTEDGSRSAKRSRTDVGPSSAILFNERSATLTHRAGKRRRDESATTEDSSPEKRSRTQSPTPAPHESTGKSPPQPSTSVHRLIPTAPRAMRLAKEAETKEDALRREQTLRQRLMEAKREKSQAGKVMEASSSSIIAVESRRKREVAGKEGPSSRMTMQGGKERVLKPATPRPTSLTAQRDAHPAAVAPHTHAITPVPPAAFPSPSGPGEQTGTSVAVKKELLTEAGLIPPQPNTSTTARPVEKRSLTEVELRDRLLEAKARKVDAASRSQRTTAKSVSPAPPAEEEARTRTPPLVASGGSPPSSPVGPQEEIEEEEVLRLLVATGETARSSPAGSEEEDQEIPGLIHFYPTKGKTEEEVAGVVSSTERRST